MNHQNVLVNDQQRSDGQKKLWISAATAFTDRYLLVEEIHLHHPTPCEHFDVDELTRHAIGTQIDIGRLLGGQALDDDDWSSVRASMDAVLVRSDSLDGEVLHPHLGVTPRTRLLAIATNDLLVHTWDLSRAIGVDDTLPTVNLEPAIAGIEAFPPSVRRQLFGAALEIDKTADAQARLLAVAGRRP